MQEQELIQRLLKGDSQAFERLVASQQGRVYQVCYGFVFNKEDAEDLTQEVFIEVYRSLKNFRNQSTLSTWIYRISVTKSLDLIRKKNARKRWSIIRKVIGEGEGEVDVVSASRTPDQALEDKERMEFLQGIIQKLPDSQRIALTLSKIDGLTSKEVAEVMGVKPASVDILVHRAKKNLKEKLGKK